MMEEIQYLIVEVAIQAQYIWMAQVGLYLYLSSQLVLNLVLLQLCLVQCLSESDKLSARHHIVLMLLCKVNDALHRRVCGSLEICLAPNKLTFRATMYFDFLSRARYTLPNFPCPSGLPMSKSASCHLRSLLVELAVPLEPVRASVSTVLTCSIPNTLISISKLKL